MKLLSIYQPHASTAYGCPATGHQAEQFAESQAPQGREFKICNIDQ